MVHYIYVCLFVRRAYTIELYIHTHENWNLKRTLQNYENSRKIIIFKMSELKLSSQTFVLNLFRKKEQVVHVGLIT